MQYRRWTVVLGFAIGVAVVKLYDKLHPKDYPASPSPKWVHSDTPRSASNDTRNGLIVIPIFPLITNSNYKKTNFNKPDKVEERMLDFMESLQKTLNHQFVDEVHILYDQENMPTYVTSKIGHNPKLEFRKVEDAYNISRVLAYVHNHYIDQLVMITNGDIYPGEGFAHIDYDVMKSKHLFYTPSRHGRQEKRCKMAPDMCDPEGRYASAHDTYIFIPTKPFPKVGLQWLKNNHWDSYGTENVMLYTYQNELGYKVLNPCKRIFLYHNHCSMVRHNDRVRIQKHHFRVNPSYDLQ